MKPPIKNRIMKCAVSFFLLFAIIVISYGPVQPQKATAFIDYEPLNTVFNGISKAYNFLTSEAITSLQVKEYVLDPIAWNLANVALHMMSRSIINWINSGFQGSPSFVTDLNGFLRDTADTAMGEYLKNQLGLGFLCSPFKLNVLVALNIQYQHARDYEFECTLSGVVNNIENFFSNDSIADGGWEGWFSLTTQAGNNPYGALVMVQQNSGVWISNAKGEQQQLLSFGRGFLSYKQCEYEDDEDENGNALQHCTVTTPGAAIQGQLDETLRIGGRRLIVADEIDEIIGALFAQLAQQAFTGVGGLLGLTQSGYSSDGSSYLDAATAVNSAYAAQQSSRGTYNVYDPIINSIDTENQYLSLQNQIVSMINNAQLYKENNYGTSTCSNEPFPASLTTARTTALNEASSTQNTVIYLNQLDTQLTNTSDPQVQANIYQIYQGLQENGTLHDQTDITHIQYEVIGSQNYGLTATINNYEDKVSQDCS